MCGCLLSHLHHIAPSSGAGLVVPVLSQALLEANIQQLLQRHSFG